MDTQQKISAVRALLKQDGLNGFLIPKADEFQGEFLAPYAERLKWLTGFTGSAGIAVILEDKACVMSDARYTLQLNQEVDSAIFETGDSVKAGVHGWLKDNAEDGALIGFGPWLHTPAQIKKIQEESGCVLKPVSENLVDTIWEDQPEKPKGQVAAFPEALAGRSVNDKKQEIAKTIADHGAQAAVITMPDSLSWLLNMRGADIQYIPYVLSYAVVYADASEPVHWIVDPDKLQGVDIGDDIKIADLNIIETLTGAVLLDESRSPIWFKTKLESQGVEIVNEKDPCIAPKALKTDAEIAAIRKAHIADGIALTKFLYWLDRNALDEKASELSAGEKLEELRTHHPAFKGPSFPTIAGFGPNGAIVHYRSSEKTNAALEEGSLLLVDSGGQYCDEEMAGTTDITRTIAVGQTSEDMKTHFTLVLKGHIALAQARFPVGTTGAQIDTLARQAVWNEGLDFAHGTGHGVGCYLCVHEDAASISSRGQDPFEAGMLLSNEPGYYEEGAYGIRTENLVLVVEKGQCESTNTKMLGFETVSFAPIDLSLIEPNMLSEDEKNWLNAYHALVFDNVSEGLDENEKEWLELKTKPVS